MKVLSTKIKKFDEIELLSGKKTVDRLLTMSGIDWLCIKYMDGSRTFAQKNEEVEVKRDKFYALGHTEYKTNIFELL